MAIKVSDADVQFGRSSYLVCQGVNVLEAKPVFTLINKKSQVHEGRKLENLAQSQVVQGYDCSDIWQRNNLTTSGIYLIKPEEAEFSFPVYCEMSKNGGWTLIQKHNGEDGLSFERMWTEYENGFGDLQGEHWLGLKYIYALTNQKDRTSKLHISVGDFDGYEAYARYDSFSIGNASSYYKLSAGNYSGTAGDAFLGDESNTTNQYGSTFSAVDLATDNCHPFCMLGDIIYLSCSKQFSAGWWFNACGSANLNGVWRSPPRYRYWASSVSWPTWRPRESLKFSKMYVI
ncbi:angiopoietin-related protein 5-like [Bufo bufo]|uniref:angiopoietin-related protein 5-like n=1 Tax=Bufo bufo TaxID=8384 RepID=UPI001ABE757C|nr:angiopoietin-related protein 5-like [Bufo bufo]